MAFQKAQELPTGATANYYRIEFFRVDYATKEASAHLAAYVSPTAKSPIVPIFAKLRLNGDDFDRFLAKSVLKAEDRDVVAQLYEAVRGYGVVCDYGEWFFLEAEGV